MHCDTAGQLPRHLALKLYCRPTPYSGIRPGQFEAQSLYRGADKFGCGLKAISQPTKQTISLVVLFKVRIMLWKTKQHSHAQGIQIHWDEDPLAKNLLGYAHCSSHYYVISPGKLSQQTPRTNCIVGQCFEALLIFAICVLSKVLPTIFGSSSDSSCKTIFYIQQDLELMLCFTLVHDILVLTITFLIYNNNRFYVDLMRKWALMALKQTAGLNLISG